jgi:hypothetical protein
MDVGGRERRTKAACSGAEEAYNTVKIAQEDSLFAERDAA